MSVVASSGSFDFSAASVGDGLLTAAISYAGGAVLTSALGVPTLRDVHTWIAEAVAQIETFIAVKLEQQIMDQMTANLEGVSASMADYAGLSWIDQHLEANIGEVVSCDETALPLVQLAIDNDPACFVATAALGYLLLARQARFNYDKGTSHITSLKPYFDAFLLALCQMRDRIAQPLGPETHVKLQCWNEDIPFGGPNNVLCVVMVDDKIVASRIGPAAMKAEVSASLQTVYNQQCQVFTDRKNAFLTAMNQSLTSAIEAYRTMCAKIGHVYNPPNGVTPS